MNVVDSWLKQLHEEVGSDLFVTVGAPPCIKVHGKIKPISTDLLTAETAPVSYTHLTLPTTCNLCRSRWSPYQ